MMVTCPPGYSSGMTLQVQMPAPQVAAAPIVVEIDRSEMDRSGGQVEYYFGSKAMCLCIFSMGYACFFGQLCALCGMCCQEECLDKQEKPMAHMDEAALQNAATRAANRAANAAVTNATASHQAEVELMRAENEAQRKRADELKAERDKLEAEKAAEQQKAKAEKNAFEKEMRDAAKKLGGIRAYDAALDTKFNSNTRSFQSAPPIEAAYGVKSYLNVDTKTLNLGMAKGIKGIEDEIEANGTETDKECLHYVLYEKAGKSKRTFQEAQLRRDRNRDGSALTPELGPKARMKFNSDGDPVPMEFADFCAAKEAKLAQLERAHVLALRLYSTEAFHSINSPLRDPARRKEGRPHPLPLTVMYINEGVGKLRAVEAALDSESTNKSIDLYRGMANLSVPQEFLKSGGTEVSTAYAASPHVIHPCAHNTHSPCRCVAPARCAARANVDE